jgi:hypothetical protein
MYKCVYKLFTFKNSIYIIFYNCTDRKKYKLICACICVYIWKEKYKSVKNKITNVLYVCHEKIEGIEIYA